MDLEDEGRSKGFSWENRYTQSWEILQEDDQGSLQHSINEVQRKQYLQRRRALADKALRRGILRHLFVVLDLSKSAADTDFSPNRAKFMLTNLKSFSKKYYEQNPLSQLGVVIMREGLAERLLDLSANSKDTVESLSFDPIPKGEASIQNALTVVNSMLKHVPSHGTKEILILQSGISSCDSGDLGVMIAGLKKSKVRVSCISLAGEVYMIKKICKDTFGSYLVSINEGHYEDLLTQFITPPPVNTAESGILSYLIPMGFPLKLSGEESICACHNLPITNGFQCPQCKSRICQVPVDCPVCSLTLVTAPHLARSYHHIFPVPRYELFITDEKKCSGCFKDCRESSQLSQVKVGGESLKCSVCSHIFCADCDIFVHEVLFNCPTCVSK